VVFLNSHLPSLDTKHRSSPVIENDPIVDQNCDLGRFKL
jgi:hypothetical protein